MNPPQKDTAGKVMEAIKGGRVKMHGRWYYRFRHLFIIIALVVFIVLLVWHSSFELYVLDHSGRLYLLTLGWTGLVMFLQTFNWSWTCLGLGALLVLLWLMRRNTATYRWPWLIYLGAVFGLITALGLLIYLTPLHSAIHRASPNGQFPIPRAYEHRADLEPERVTTGVVTNVSAAGFDLSDRDYDVDQVIVSATTKFNNGLVKDGDVVIVIGREVDEIITAEQVRKLPEHYRQEVWD